MIDKLGDAGSGRAAVEVQAVNFNNAVDAWRKAGVMNLAKTAPC